MGKNRHKKTQVTRPDVNIATYTDKYGRGKTVITFRNGTDEFIEFAYVNIKIKDGCMYFEKGNVDSGGVRLNNTAHHIQCSNQNMQSVFRSFNGDYPLSITDNTSICYIKLSDRVTGSEPKPEAKDKPDTDVKHKADKSIKDTTVETPVTESSKVSEPAEITDNVDNSTNNVDKDVDFNEAPENLPVDTEPEQPEYDTAFGPAAERDLKEFEDIHPEMDKKEEPEKSEPVSAVEAVLKKADEIDDVEALKNLEPAVPVSRNDFADIAKGRDKVFDEALKAFFERDKNAHIKYLDEAIVILTVAKCLVSETSANFGVAYFNGSSIEDIAELIDDIQSDLSAALKEKNAIPKITFVKLKTMQKLIQAENYAWGNVLSLELLLLNALNSANDNMTTYNNRLTN